MANRIVWFDMPVKDLQRAVDFYSELLAVEVKEMHPDVAVIASEAGEVSGCLFKSDEHLPSRQGPLLYMNVDGRLQEAVDIVQQKGGEIERAVHSISPYGSRAIVIDGEGNRIALHSQ